MENLKNYSNLELIKELMNRAITHEELDEICNKDYPNDVVTLEEFSTSAITIKLWGPALNKF